MSGAIGADGQGVLIMHAWRNNRLLFMERKLFGAKDYLYMAPEYPTYPKQIPEVSSVLVKWNSGMRSN